MNENNLFNGRKLKRQLKNKKINTMVIAKDLNVSTGRVSELFNGLLYEELLIQICNKYNLNIKDFYSDFIEPEHMKILRKNIELAQNKGFELAIIAENCNISKQLINNIVNCNTFICHTNTTNKINNSITNLIGGDQINVQSDYFNLKQSIGNIAYNKLLNESNKNFEGNINETLKFIINTYFHN